MDLNVCLVLEFLICIVCIHVLQVLVKQLDSILSTLNDILNERCDCTAYF